MKPENAIEVRNVRKHFKVYKDKGHMLRERIIHFNRNKYENREVLKGISFDVKKGESVGLIGKNGCGKSTTLKLLTRILRPNDGTIDIQGRVCSLIELGAGFHPDMSGRENIYINASIFGIKAKEVDKRLNDIIRFSELEEFIDNPVRTYSSGMYMRLAFSVAINVDADILLIDEILAVGDNSFQTKCFNKLKSLKDQGTTIVIVSHALGQVEKLCDRAIWIDEGKIREDGPAREICKLYLERMEESRLERAELEYRMQLKEDEERKELEKKEQVRRQEEEKEEQRKAEERRKKREEEKRRKKSCYEIATQCCPDAHREGDGKAHYTEVKVLDKDGNENLSFHTGDKLIVKLKYVCDEENFPLNFAAAFTRSDWVYCYGTRTFYDSQKMIPAHKEGEVEVVFPELTLLEGEYFLDVRILDDKNVKRDEVFSIVRIKILPDKPKKDNGIIKINHEWNIK